MFKFIQRACFRYAVANSKADAEIRSVPGKVKQIYLSRTQATYFWRHCIR